MNMTAMKMARRSRLLGVALSAGLSILTGGAGVLLGLCGPFTDVAADAFCPFVLEIFYLGITTGTTATTYDPGSNVTRLQMAAFLSRTVDGVLKRGSRRAALDQFWSSQNSTVLGVTTLGGTGRLLRSDGADIWVGNTASGTVNRVRASDGKLLETWTGSPLAFGVLVAMGRIFVSGDTNPGSLYRIDPSQAAGSVTTVATNVGVGAEGITFDGARIWTANGNGTVSIITPGPSIPWTVTTVSIGLQLNGAVFDGNNVWVTEVASPGKLDKLDANGAVLMSVTAGTTPLHPVFDGSNIWVPSGVSNATVIRASTGAILSILTGNGLESGGTDAAFDGQRVLFTSQSAALVSLWKAADLTPIGNVALGDLAFGACSDGTHFWLTVQSGGRLLRF